MNLLWFVMREIDRASKKKDTKKEGQKKESTQVPKREEGGESERLGVGDLEFKIGAPRPEIESTSLI